MGVRKHSNLASYALGNVLKYRTRSVAIIIALFVSTSILCSVEFIREGVVTDVSDSVDEGPDIVLQRLVGGRQVPIPDNWISNVTNTTGVRVATPRVWGYSDVGSGSLLTIMGVNATEYSSMIGAVGTDILGVGRFLNESDYRKMIVGQGIVDMMAASAMPLQVQVGTLLSLITFDGELIEFEVIGIFASESKIYSYDMILTDIQSAREVLGYENATFTDIAVWTNYGSDLNSVAFRLDTGISEARVLTSDAIRDSMLKAYTGRAGITALLWVILLLSVVLLAFTVSSAGSEEARREVGLLKALGFDTVDVLEIRMLECVTLSLLGVSLGISFAIIFDFILGAPLLAGYILGWSLVLLPGGIPLTISLSTIFIVYAVGLIPILVAAVVPSWRNAITEPDIVLRGV
ncbi:MAG: ABC transporter permease [Candidatus Thorarchaeota archaeon]